MPISFLKIKIYLDKTGLIQLNNSSETNNKYGNKALLLQHTAKCFVIYMLYEMTYIWGQLCLIRPNHRYRAYEKPWSLRPLTEVICHFL